MAIGPKTCALCGRSLGDRREKHHLVPRSQGGRETVDLHPICHRKIHATLTERELRDRFDTIARLRGHPDIARFLAWIAGKPPNFHNRTSTTRRLKSRR